MITLDWETYYDKANYSLKCMTYEEYIRDPRFQPIMVSVKQDEAPAVVITGHEIEIYEQLKQYNWDQPVCSHNALFDMAILAWRFGIYPKFMCDTFAMFRKLYGIERSCSLKSMAEFFGLPEKGGYVEDANGLRREQFTAQMLKDYGEYCAHDSFLCYESFKRMKPFFPTTELMAIDWTCQIFARPTLRINATLAQSELDKFRAERGSLLNRLGVTLDGIRSDAVMADLLRNLGVDPPTKESPKQKNPDGSPKELWAFAKTDVAFLDLLEHDDPDVVTLVEARLGAKTSQVETRLEAFCGIAKRGPLPYPLGYAAALPTDRWQAALGQKINLQNLPRPPKNGRSPLRDAIEPPPGYKIGVIDLSQIEMRVALWLAGQQDALEMLRHGVDLYADMASETYGYKVHKDTHPMERFVGKVECLSCQYGVGGPKFTRMLQVAARKEGLVLADESEEFGLRCVQGYRRKMHCVVKAWRACEDALVIMAQGGCGTLFNMPIVNGMLQMPDGMWLRYPNLRYYTSEETGKSGWVYDKYDSKTRRARAKWIYGGLLFENICQRIARGVMRDGILNLRQHFWVAGSVHDEAIYIVPETTDLDAANQLANQCMVSHPLVLAGLPLKAEGKIGDCYGDAK
jgi:DNA polymerase